VRFYNHPMVRCRCLGLETPPPHNPFLTTSPPTLSFFTPARTQSSGKSTIFHSKTGNGFYIQFCAGDWRLLHATVAPAKAATSGSRYLSALNRRVSWSRGMKGGRNGWRGMGKKGGLCTSSGATSRWNVCQISTAFDSGLSNASLRIPNRPMPHYSLDATCVCQHACNKFPLLRFFELHPVLPVVFGARVRYTWNLLQLDCLYLPHFSAPDIDQAGTQVKNIGEEDNLGYDLEWGKLNKHMYFNLIYIFKIEIVSNI